MSILCMVFFFAPQTLEWCFVRTSEPLKKQLSVWNNALQVLNINLQQRMHHWSLLMNFSIFLSQVFPFLFTFSTNRVHLFLSSDLKYLLLSLFALWCLDIQHSPLIHIWYTTHRRIRLGMSTLEWLHMQISIGYKKVHERDESNVAAK